MTNIFGKMFRLSSRGDQLRHPGHLEAEAGGGGEDTEGGGIPLRQFPTMDDLSEDIADIHLPRSKNFRQANSCKAATLSAWLAFLSCSIIIFYAVINVFDSLIVNERFWKQAEMFITKYMDSRAVCNVNNNEKHP